MKKTILPGLLILSALPAFSQDIPAAASAGKTKTFELSLKGGAHSTWLFNKNISNEGDNMDYANAWGFNYGLGFSAYFGKVGFGFDVLMGNHKGGYTGKVTAYDSITNTQVSLFDYTSNVNLKTIQIPVFFKYKAEKGFYLEVGPQINLVNGADYHADYNGGVFTGSYDTTVVKYYSSNYISGVLGLGYQATFGESGLSMQVGARFQYGFTDLKGVDGYGGDLNEKLVYPNSASTNAVSGGLMLGLVYKLNK